MPWCRANGGGRDFRACRRWPGVVGSVFRNRSWRSLRGNVKSPTYHCDRSRRRCDAEKMPEHADKLRVTATRPWRRGETTARRSELVTAMDGDDAVGEVAHLHMTETGGFHHGLERVLVGMLADRFGEVLIAVGVVGEQATQTRQHMER